MENSYTADNTTCKLIQSKSETIKLLLDYSKCLTIVEAKGIQFENNMN